MQSGIIYNADCLTGMSDIPDSAVDMVLCDLPYGTTRNKWDSVLPLDTLWSHYRRIVKPSGVVALFCDGVFMARLMLSNLDMWRYNLIWDKRRGSDYLNANIKPLKSHEEIAIFYRKKPTYNKQRWYSTPYTRTESAALSDNYGYRRRASSASLEGERNPLSILSFAHDADRAHPTQKPVKLLEWLILTYTNEQETILDNCAGSGSTCVAAIQTNRRFIGYETDTRYYEIAQARIAKAEHAQEMTRSIGGGGY